MKKILAFAGSNSTQSINLKLVRHTVGLISEKEFEVSTLDMSGMPFPIYSEDAERKEGFKNSLVELIGDIKEADGLIIGVNEHNRSMSAYFKNLLDWMSRFDYKFLDSKKIFLVSTSDGDFGGSRALAMAELILPRFGGEVTTTFSLPNFSKNFTATEGITNEELASENKIKLNEYLSLV